MHEKLSQKYFKSLFDYFSEPLLVINKADLNILYCNFEFEDLIGKSSAYILDNSMDVIFSFDLFFLSNLKEVEKKRSSFIIKDLVKIKNIEYEVKCIIEDDFKQLMTLFFFKVENTNSNSLADQNIKFLNDTLAILGHEICNPITSIKIATDLINKKIAKADSDLTDIIKKEANRIITLFDNFQVFNLNEQVMRKENIHELLRFSLMKFKDNRNKLNIEEYFDPSLPEINVNRDTLLQVFDNLFKNSFEASKFNENSFIRITTKFVEGETIKIPNVLDKVRKIILMLELTIMGLVLIKILSQNFFSLFYDKEKGLWYWSFLVKKIINDHNGHISIKSKNGLTEVSINLQFTGLMNKKILIVDDDFSLRTVMIKALSSKSIDVRSVSSVSEAWVLISNESFDLIICDVLLPDGDGLELVKKIKDKNVNQKIIIISAQNNIITAIKADELKVFEYLPKPIDLNDLVISVNQSLKDINKVRNNDVDFDLNKKLPMIGSSVIMQNVYKNIAKTTKTNFSVLITGI